MNGFFRIVVLILGLSCSLTIIRLLVKKKISERISLLWLISSVLILIVSIVPGILDKVSKAIGVDYPPSLLFLLASLLLLLVCFLHSIQISKLNAQVRELTQLIAINGINNKEDIDLESKKIIDTKYNNY